MDYDSEKQNLSLPDNLGALCEALEKEDYINAERIINLLFTGFPAFMELHKISSLPGDQDPILDDLLSETLDQYLSLADRLFGKSPYESAQKSLQDQMKQAMSMLQSTSEGTVNQARKIIDDAWKTYDEEVKKIGDGRNFDPTAIRVYWKLWPVLNKIIRELPTDDYVSFAARLYGILSEGLRSRGAIISLKELFDDILPL